MKVANGLVKKLELLDTEVVNGLLKDYFVNNYNVVDIQDTVKVKIVLRETENVDLEELTVILHKNRYVNGTKLANLEQEEDVVLLQRNVLTMTVLM